MNRRILVAAALFALGLTAGVAAAADAAKAAPAAAAETQAPVFLTIVPEGGRVTPPPVDPKVAEQAAATESVMATVANLQRVGLFAVQFMALLLLAGLVGALIAGLITLIKSRQSPSSDLR